MALSTALVCWIHQSLGPSTSPVLDAANMLHNSTFASVVNIGPTNTNSRNSTFASASSGKKKNHRKFWPKIPSPQKVTVCKTLDISIVSAVPVFGKHESYIALITESSDPNAAPLWRPVRRGQLKRWKELSEQKLFCSGPHRSHVSRIKYHGSVLICPWPPEEWQRNFFDVHLEDAEGRVLGSFVASNDPNLLGQYQIMACVRDLFEPPEEDKRMRSGVLSQVVQWMEWSLMNGVEHFLVYKFNGTDSIEEDVLQPYFDAGVATMVYFDSCPQHPDIRHGHTINDCLFRARNHAKWLMPVIDFDEYWYVPGGLVRALKEEVFGNLDQVHSLSFKRYRFAKAAMNQLDISSTRRAELHSKAPGYVNQKQFVSTDSVYRVSTHDTVIFDEKKKSIEIDLNMGVIHHYRFPWNASAVSNETGNLTAESLLDENANVTDESLLMDVPSLTEAIRQRFGLENSREVNKLLQKLAQTRPPNCR
eukprot:Skav202198  [mRNA]  locus=scaffold191:101617:103047:- [translate_table: standard]